MLGLAMFAAVSWAQAPLPASVQAEHAAAVAAARAGRYAEALTVLERLRAAYPNDPSLLFDQIAVLGWSENDARALALADGLDDAAAPDYVRLAVAKAARNLRRYDVAAERYRRLAGAEPALLDARIGLLMTEADRSNRAGVLAALDSFTATELEAASVQLARAYALRAIGEAFAALSAYDRVLETAPENRDALRGKALTLRSMLLPRQARELAEAHPGILSDAELARLRVDELALRVRLTARTPYPDGERRRMTAATLAELDAFAARNGDPAAAAAVNLDRIVALADGNESAAAVGAFEALDDPFAGRQPYVLGAVARAYLQLRRPREALAALDNGLEIAPGDIELRFARVYALLDLERYSEAFEATAALLADLPAFNAEPGSVVVKGNPDHMRAELVAGIAEAYGDQLAAAQTRFETLLAAAPNNRDLRHELANVYRWRGWLDRSLYEYRQVLAVDPELLPARLGYAHAQMDAHQYRRVAETLAELDAAQADAPAVERLAERWQLHNEREVDVSGSFGDSDGATFGTNYYAIDGFGYTRPLDYRLRVFVHTHDAYAEFPEGEGRRRRIGAGAQYRGRHWTVAGELSGSRDGGRAGLRGNADWRIGDVWTLATLIELDSDAVQLRAYRAGVEADVVGATARYTPHESASMNLGWRHERLSDGNHHSSVFADGRYRLVNRPRWKLEATGELALSASARVDVPYFSPGRDASLTGGLFHELRIYRRYERSVSQSVGLSAGRYDQRGYAAGSVWNARYELEIAVSDRLRLGFGAERARQRFDGEREMSTLAFATVNARF